MVPARPKITHQYSRRNVLDRPQSVIPQFPFTTTSIITETYSVKLTIIIINVTGVRSGSHSNFVIAIA